MPLPVVVDHYLVNASFLRVGGDSIVNTFCFKNESFERSPQEVAEDIRDTLDVFYGDGSTGSNTAGAILANTLHSLRYVIYDLGNPDAGGFELASETYTTTGSTSGAQAPQDLAIVISWRTAKRGRSFRGRTYVGPLEGSVVGNNGRPIDIALNALAGAAPPLIGALLTRSVSLAILSRTKGLATEVNGGYVDDSFDTQRRRDPGPTKQVLFTPP